MGGDHDGNFGLKGRCPDRKKANFGEQQQKERIADIGIAHNGKAEPEKQAHVFQCETTFSSLQPEMTGSGHGECGAFRLA